MFLYYIKTIKKFFLLGKKFILVKKFKIPLFLKIMENFKNYQSSKLSVVLVIS